MALMTEPAVDIGPSCFNEQYKNFYFLQKKEHSSRRFKSDKHFIRAFAKKHAHSWEANKHRFADGKEVNLVNLDHVPRDQRRRYLENAITPSCLLRPRALELLSNQVRGRPVSSRHFKAARCIDEVEGRLIAKTDVHLPSDGELKRPPSLGREDAFRDESTTKPSRGVRTVAPRASGEDEQVAELYKMGLLYDEGEEMGTGMTGSVFDLNSIRHEEPVYAIRASKRARPSKAASGPLYHPLDLELSFSDMTNDELIARLMAAGHDVTMEDEGAAKSPASSPSSQRSFTPLRIVYERTPDGESSATVDVDTSQPPDFMLDDYDCFSDSDLDGEIGGVGTGNLYYSEREMDDATPGMQETGAWVVLGADGS